MSLVPDGHVAILRRPARQCENRAAQVVGAAGDVDRVDAIVVSDADLQQRLRAPARCDHNARDTVDEHHDTGPRPLGEPPGFLGDLSRATGLGPRVLAQSMQSTQSFTGPAGQLLRGRRRPVQQAGDRLERHGEHVVQHEGDALLGREAVENDK